MSLLTDYELNSIIKVRIITNTIKDMYSDKTTWYNVGEIYSVRHYRFNLERYWEITNWDGDVNKRNFWILKRHTEIINPLFDIPDDLFEI